MKQFIVTTTLILFILITVAHSSPNRALKIVSDLDHRNGKIGSYNALIIGIQNYDDPGIPDLETPLKDAVDMADILKRKYGFKVELLLDNMATRRGIDSALRKLVSKAQSDDSVLIYYAGHGDLDRQYNDGWWIPVDAQAGVSVTYIDNVQIQKAMRNIKARHVLLISDSCYSGTLFGQARAMPSLISDKYYLNLYNEKSRWGMTSGNKTPVSDSGTGGHSVFAYQLIKKLKKNDKPFISAQEIYLSIAPIIANNSEQAPLCRPIKGTGDQGGEFIFISIDRPASSSPKSSSDIDSSLVAGRKKIEQEKKELEKLKQEIELNKIEKERKELEKLRAQMEKEKPIKTASINPVDQNKKILVKGGQYIKYENGIIYDKKTGLEWFIGPDSYFGRQKAANWIEELKIEGGNWRMPKKKELESLFKSGEGTRNITPLIETTGWYVWYHESVLQFFSLKDGSSADDLNISGACWFLCHRAFAVRSTK